MEGLISARTVNPIRPPSCCKRLLQSHRCATQKLYKYPLKLMTQFKTITPMATSARSTDSIIPTHLDNTQPSKDVLEIWQNADAVCFDVDSTVCIDEGIDEFAEFCGAGKAVAEWTARAMGGSVPFEEALAARLSLFNPSWSQLQEFLEKRPP
ncbi:Phosphoserine phosphatase protein, partial [Thalictrum thalictroides]